MSSGVASAAARRRCVSPRRAIASPSSRRGAGSTRRRSRTPRGGCPHVLLGAEARAARHPADLAAAGRDHPGRRGRRRRLARLRATRFTSPYRPPFYEDPQWAAHHRLARLSSRRTTTRRERMLGVVRTRRRRRPTWSCSTVAEEMGVGSHSSQRRSASSSAERGPGSRPPTPSSAVRARREPGCTECGECMTGCRHGREEHAAQELPASRRAGRREGGAAHDRDGCCARVPTALRDLTGTLRRLACGSRRRALRRRAKSSWQRGQSGTQKLLHRMRDEGRLRTCRRGLASSPARTRRRYWRRADHLRRERRLHPRRRHHVVVPSERPHAHRARPLRTGQQLDGASHDRPRRRRQTLPSAHLGSPRRRAIR